MAKRSSAFVQVPRIPSNLRELTWLVQCDGLDGRGWMSCSTWGWRADGAARFRGVVGDVCVDTGDVSVLPYPIVTSALCIVHALLHDLDRAGEPAIMPVRTKTLEGGSTGGKAAMNRSERRDARARSDSSACKSQEARTTRRSTSGCVGQLAVADDIPSRSKAGCRPGQPPVTETSPISPC